MRSHITIALLGLVLSAAPSASAKTVTTKFAADLDACCAAPSEDNKGKAEYKISTNKGVTKQEQFRAEAEIELPSAALGLNDATDAQAADIRVILSRASVDYAECSLLFWEIEREIEMEGRDAVVIEKAKFVLGVRNFLKKGSPFFRALVGECDVDLGTLGTQPGVPVVEAGDVATVTLVDPSEAAAAPASRALDKDFLQGTLEAD